MTSLRSHRKWITRTSSQEVTIYQVTDRLRDGRSVRVPGDQIATTVSGWLAELGTRSPLVEDLARAARAGDWPAVHALGEHLSINVTSLPAVVGQRSNSALRKRT
ncbi:MAG: hypothetical protein ACRDUX_05985 [Mycobacterium sp.]